MAEAHVRHTSIVMRGWMNLGIIRAFLVWTPLGRRRVNLSRRNGSAARPRRSLTREMAAIAVFGTILPGCGSEARGERAAERPRDALVSLEWTTGDGEPDMAVLASFALEYLLGTLTEDEREGITEWYFVDAVFAPFAYDGRLYPPEDTRGWVERVEPLSVATRDKLEGMGFTVCNSGEDVADYCDAVAEVGVHDHLFIGIGELRRSSERMWSFDLGFGAYSRWGGATGGARVLIRRGDDAWSLSRSQTLWVDH